MHAHTLAAQYDVVVVGGGLVGASFAMNLAQQTKDSGYSILVVEAVDNQNFDQQPSFDCAPPRCLEAGRFSRP